MVRPDDRWHAALDTLGAHRGDRDAAFEKLADTYASPSRHYHTFEHASSVVDTVLSLHEPGDDWSSAVIAAWYHDAVYEPDAGPGANEGSSAVLAERELTALGVSFSAVGTVTRLVCLTATHQPAIGDRTGSLLCDADLSSLGAPESDYDASMAEIRAEYAAVSDEDWRIGRRAVLRGFLDRAAIFTTAGGHERWEAAARTNISRELAALG